MFQERKRRIAMKKILYMFLVLALAAIHITLQRRKLLK